MKHLVARPKSKELAPLRTVLMKHLVAPNEPAPLLIVFMKHLVARPKSKELYGPASSLG
jgi:hypothetical protein